MDKWTRALTTAVLVFVACGGGAGQTLTGVIRAPECRGLVRVEAELRNGSGDLVAKTETSEDLAVKLEGNVGADDPACRVEFTFDDVPKADFYELTIGQYPGPTWSIEELERMDWQVELTL